MKNIGSGINEPDLIQTRLVKWNSITIVFSCWADLARLLAGIKKNRPMYIHVIFIVFFKFQIESAGDSDFNQFLLDIPSF